MGRGRLDLSISLNAEWGSVEHVRDAAGCAVMSLCGDVALRDSVAMVSAELLENAVKFGAWRETGDTRIRYRLTGTERDVVVHVSNHVDVEDHEGRDHLQALASTLAWLADFTDPSEAFRQRLEQHYDGEDAGRPMLGLARVAHESRCRLSHELGDDGFVVMEARFQW